MSTTSVEVIFRVKVICISVDGIYVSGDLPNWSIKVDIVKGDRCVFRQATDTPWFKPFTIELYKIGKPVV